MKNVEFTQLPPQVRERLRNRFSVGYSAYDEDGYEFEGEVVVPVEIAEEIYWMVYEEMKMADWDQRSAPATPARDWRRSSPNTSPDSYLAPRPKRKTPGMAVARYCLRKMAFWRQRETATSPLDKNEQVGKGVAEGAQNAR